MTIDGFSGFREGGMMGGAVATDFVNEGFVSVASFEVEREDEIA